MCYISSEISSFPQLVLQAVLSKVSILRIKHRNERLCTHLILTFKKK